MEGIIEQYLGLLFDNKLSQKLKIDEIEECDNRDEIMAEINEYEEQGEPIPDRYFEYEVNGFSTSSEFDDFLFLKFNSFKSAFNKKLYTDDGSLKKMLNKIMEKKEEVEGQKRSFMLYEDIHTASLLDVKIKYFHLLIEFLTGGTVREKKMLSFRWMINPEAELPELYQMMLGKFITEDNKESHFIDIFSKTTITTPVKWHDNNATELLYFIIRLIEKSAIEGDITRLDYQKIQYCFRDHHNSTFEQNFKELRQQIKQNKLPKQDTKDAIDAILYEF